MMHLRKNNFFILMLFCWSSVHAQNFKSKANLQPVNSSGFYLINITPQLSSYLKTDFSDLRIADEKDMFVPYIILSKQPSFVSHNYTRLPVIKNSINDSGQSILIIKNDAHKKISSLALLIRNAAVNRNASINGSDDSIHWFTISENITLEKESAIEADRYVQTINFPISSYVFFKLIIDNKKNNPLSIIETGSYVDTGNNEPSSYITNPSSSFIQTDSSDRKSYIRVHQNAAYHNDKIHLQIESPKFFERDIEVINSSGIVFFKISSDKKYLNLPSFNDMDWSIRIYNGDNPPLKINSIILQQELQNVIAYMQAGKNYHLLMDDSLAVKPVYDLQNFKDSIPSDLPQLNVVSFEKNQPAEINTSNKMLLSSAWIWALIIIVLVVLGFVTYRLTKEMSKKNIDNNL